MKKSDEIQIIEDFFNIIQSYTENNTVYYDDIQIFYKVLQILDRKNKEIRKIGKANNFYKREIKSLNSRYNNLERALVEKNMCKIKELEIKNRILKRELCMQTVFETPNKNYTQGNDDDEGKFIIFIIGCLFFLLFYFFFME